MTVRLPLSIPSVPEPRQLFMENQIPDDVVKDRFDRLLAEVQEISRERCARLKTDDGCFW